MSTFIQMEADFLLWVQINARAGWLTPLMKLFSLLGDKGIFWIAVTLILLCFKRTRRLGAYCAVSIAITFVLVNGVIKPLVARPRPYDLFPELEAGLLVKPEHDYSFPSGHSANAFAAAWILLRMAKKRYGIPAVTLASLMAISRVYVSVHYPTDVICGILIAIGMAELTLHVLPKVERKLFPKKKKRRRKKRPAAAAGRTGKQ